MSYPTPPWNLYGEAMQTVQLVDIERARRYVPESLSIISVLPGKTLGVLFFARYGPGSALEYHELIVAPALVRYRAAIGVWISHIYVDNPHSMAGWHEVWGVPKELAEFTWGLDSSGQVEVRQGGQALCAFNGRPPTRTLPLPMILPAISHLKNSMLWFAGSAFGRFGIAPGAVTVPPDSPFAPLRMEYSGRFYHLRDMKFVANPPRVLGSTPITRELP